MGNRGGEPCHVWEGDSWRAPVYKVWTEGPLRPLMPDQHGSKVAHVDARSAALLSAMHESAGRQTPAGKRHGNKWLTAMLVEAAGSVGRMHGKTIWPPSTPG